MAMRRYKRILAILFSGVMMMNITACTKNTVPKEEKKAKEKQEESVKEEKKETEFLQGITNLESAVYIPKPLDPIGEDGNPLGIPEEYLGYYTNGYYGYQIRQIDGYRLICEVVAFGYRISPSAIEVIDSKPEGLVCTFDPSLTEGTEFLLTKEGFNLEGVSYLLPETMFSFFDYTYDIVKEAGMDRYEERPIFQRFQLGEYQRADLPDPIYNLTYNDAETVSTEVMKSEPGMPSYEEYDKVLSDKITRVQSENTQPVKNRRDYEKYPKWIKYMPDSKYYIYGNPADEKIILMTVYTCQEAAFDEPYIAPDVNAGKAGTFDSTYAITEEEYAQEEAAQYWENGGGSGEKINNEFSIKIDLKYYYKKDGAYVLGSDQDYMDKTYFTMVSLNYDVPELIGMLKTSSVVLCGNPAAETGYKYFNLNCEKLKEGIATLESNMIRFGGSSEPFLDMIDGEHSVDLKAVSEEELLNAAVPLE